MPQAWVSLVARARVASSHLFSDRERLGLMKSYSSRDEGRADPQLHTHTHRHTHIHFHININPGTITAVKCH